MKVLVTRPTLFAESLCEKITHWGATPILFPTIEIVEKTPTPTFLKDIEALAEFDILLFTSRFAVHYGLTILRKVFSTFPHWEIGAIGDGTGKELIHAGIKTVHCALPPFESETFLSLPLLNQVRHKKIALFCGQDPRPLLPQTLLARGAKLSIFEVYQRKLPCISQTNKMLHIPDVVISTSQDGLKNLKILVENLVWQKLIQQTFIVVGLRMHEFAANLGICNRVLATGASDAQLLQALETLGDPVL